MALLTQMQRDFQHIHAQSDDSGISQQWRVRALFARAGAALNEVLQLCCAAKLILEAGWRDICWPIIALKIDFRQPRQPFADQHPLW